MKKMVFKKIVVLNLIAFIAPTQDAQAMWGRKSAFDLLQEKACRQSYLEDAEEKEREERIQQSDADGVIKADRTVRIESPEELFGYAGREKELEAIKAIKNENFNKLTMLLNSYGKWRPNSQFWLDDTVLIRPQILIEARTKAAFVTMINAGIDPKIICESGPAQYQGKSLVEIVKMRLGDNNPDFKSLINYMCEKKLFREFGSPEAYFEARNKEHARNRARDLENAQQELELAQQELAQKYAGSGHAKRNSHMPRALPAPIEQPRVMPEPELDHNLMKRWQDFDRSNRGEDAQSAFKITRRGSRDHDLEFSV